MFNFGSLRYPVGINSSASGGPVIVFPRSTLLRYYYWGLSDAKLATSDIFLCVLLAHHFQSVGKSLDLVKNVSVNA